MDEEHRKPKTFTSTFRLDINPKPKASSAEKQKENGSDTRRFIGHKKLEVSSVTGKDQMNKGKVDSC